MPYDVDGLLGLVAMDAVELHPWAATVDDIERPDGLVFDLDPGPGIAWEFVVETALKLRDMLHAEGHRSWPKLTGGKGLHLMVPVTPLLSHDQARAYCRAVAGRIARTAPERYTLDPAPELRKEDLPRRAITLGMLTAGEIVVKLAEARLERIASREELALSPWR